MTWICEFRPGNKTIWVVFYVESEFSGPRAQFLSPDRVFWKKDRKNKNSKNVKFLSFPLFSLVSPGVLEALGPEKLTIWVKFYVESEFQVENTRFLHPDLEN